MDRSLSVCMFSNLYPPVVSGSSTQTSALARELAKRGHRVAVVAARVDPDSPEHEERDGVSVYRLPAVRLPRLSIAFNFPWLNYTFTPANLRRIEGILDRHSPGVLHLHNHLFDLALSAAWMRRRTHRPLVLTLHTVVKHSRGLYNLLLLPADRLLLKRLVVAGADAIICPDLNVARYAREAFGREDTSIVPYGIDPPRTDDGASIRELRSRHRLDGKRIILSLGHVHEIRNRRDLVTALPDVRRAFPDALLLVVGAVATESTAALARERGVEESVVFTGPVPHEKVPALLELAELEAHWLDQEEAERTSFGIASLEAMAAGKTVLAAANPDTYGRGLLRNGDNVVIVERGKPAALAETIIGLLGDPERRAAIGRRARETVREHFSWDAVCARTVAVYERAMQACGQGAGPQVADVREATS